MSDTEQKLQHIFVYIVVASRPGGNSPAGWAAEICFTEDTLCSSTIPDPFFCQSNTLRTDSLCGSLPCGGSKKGLLAGIGETLERLPSCADVTFLIETEEPISMLNKIKVPTLDFLEAENFLEPFTFEEFSAAFKVRINHHAKRLKKLRFTCDMTIPYNDPQKLRLVEQAQGMLLKEMRRASLPQVVLIADGSVIQEAKGKGKGGWCSLLCSFPGGKKSRLFIGADSDTTVVEMEGAGIEAGLRHLEQESRVLLFFDHKALKSCLVPGFPALECTEQQRRLAELASEHVVTPFWIPAHVGLPLHDFCDRKSREAVTLLG